MEQSLPIRSSSHFVVFAPPLTRGPVPASPLTFPPPIARPLETAKLRRIMRRIRAADVAIKTSIGGGGTTGSRLQIEMLVCELANF